VKIKGDNENDLSHRDQLIRDMIYVCCLPYLSDKNRHEFINVCVSWSYSDRDENDINKSAKYKGCPYWSRKALERVDDNGNWQDDNKDKGLRHEHIVPRKIFVDAMMDYFKSIRDGIKNNEELKIDEIFKDLKKLMNKNLKGCVVTKEEAAYIDGKIQGEKGLGEYNSKMPADAYDSKPSNNWEKFEKIERPWARYETELAKEKGIEIYKIDWQFEGGRWRLKSKEKNNSSTK
jgi:hypothetical protein